MGWDLIDQEIAMRDNDQLLADWRAAQRRDEAEGGSRNRLNLWDAVRGGDYYRDRRDRERLARGASPQAVGAGVPVAREDQERAVHPVGRAVAAERARAAVRQVDRAEGAAMTRDALSKVEAGRRRLTFEEASRLADFLRVPLDRLRPG